MASLYFQSQFQENDGHLGVVRGAHKFSYFCKRLPSTSESLSSLHCHLQPTGTQPLESQAIQRLKPRPVAFNLKCEVKSILILRCEMIPCKALKWYI